MKIIEFRRHSVKDGTGGYMLGEKGYALARAVGEKQLRGQDFSHFFVSPLWRTHQTLAAFAEGAGDFDLKFAPAFDPFHKVVAEHEDAICLWHGVCRLAEMAGEDMMLASLTQEKDRVDRIAKLATDAFVAWIETLPEDAHVLVVGHSPLLEFLPYGLLGTVIPALKECNGFRLTHDGEFELDYTSFDLDAQILR